MSHKIMIKQYGLYLLRWQLSTPILALCLYFLTDLNEWAATIIANLIGGLIFFWVDKKIFNNKKSWYNTQICASRLASSSGGFFMCYNLNACTLLRMNKPEKVWEMQSELTTPSEVVSIHMPKSHRSFYSADGFLVYKSVKMAQK